MNIIKHGDKELAERKIKQTRRFKCKVCGCVFEADKEEYKCYDEQRNFYYYAECPCCKESAREEKVRGAYL